ATTDESDLIVTGPDEEGTARLRVTVTATKDAKTLSGTTDITLTVTAAPGGPDCDRDSSESSDSEEDTEEDPDAGDPVTDCPFAYAGPDLVVAPGATTVIFGSGGLEKVDDGNESTDDESETDGPDLTYAWTQREGEDVLDAGQSTDEADLAFTAPEGETYLIFDLTVADEWSNSATDSVIVYVSESSETWEPDNESDDTDTTDDDDTDTTDDSDTDTTDDDDDTDTTDDSDTDTTDDDDTDTTDDSDTDTTDDSDTDWSTGEVEDLFCALWESSSGSVTIPFGADVEVTLDKDGDDCLASAAELASDADIDIAAGVTLTSLYLRADGSGVEVSGAATVACGSSDSLEVALRGELDKEDDAYSGELTAALDEAGDCALLDGVTIESLSGTVAFDGRDVDLSIAVALSDWTPASGIAVTDLSALFVHGGDGSEVELAGSVAVTSTLGGEWSAELAGSFALDSGTWQLSADLADTWQPTSGFTLEDLRVEVSNDGDTTTGRLVGDVEVLGVTASATVQLSPDATVVDVKIGDWMPMGGVAASDVHVLYASADTTYDPEGDASAVEIGAGELRVTGEFPVPSEIRDLLGLSSDTKGTLTGTIEAGSSDYELTVALTSESGWTLIDTDGGIELTLTSVGFRIANTDGLALTADASLTIPDQPDPLALSADLAVGLDGISGSLSLTSAWTDAFGVDGLTIQEAAIAVGVSWSGTPSVGVAATATLPESIRTPLGMNAEDTVTVAVNLSATNPCFALAIGADDGVDSLALTVSDTEVVTADVVDLVIAPAGCSIGTYDYTAGISLLFQGALLGVTVDVDATLDLSAGSPSLDAHVDVGTLNIPDTGISILESSVDLTISPTDGFAFAFSGGVELGDDSTTVTVAGSVEANGAGVALTLDGDLSGLNFGGYGLQEAHLYLDVAIGATFSLEAAADVTVALGDNEISGSFAFTFSGGTVRELAGSLSIGTWDGTSCSDAITLGAVELCATATFDYQRGRDASFTFAGLLGVGGLSLEVAGELGATYIALSTALELDSVGSFEVSGQLVTADGTDREIDAVTCAADTSTMPATVSMTETPTAAGAGDFHLATTADLELGGFAIETDLAVTSVGDTFAIVAAGDISLGDASSASLSGCIDKRTDGWTLAVAGDAELDIAGIEATGAVALVLQPGHGVSVDGSFDIELGTVVELGASLDGSFRADSDGISYTLAGEGSLSVSDWDVADASFWFSNEPTKRGLTASIDLDLGVTTLNADITFGAGGTFLFSTTAEINLVVASASLGVELTNCHDGDCTSGRTKSTSLSINGELYALGFHFSVAATIADDGSFSVDIKSDADFVSGSLNLGLIAIRASVRFHAELHLESDGSGIEWDAGLGGSVSAGYKWAGEDWVDVEAGIEGTLSPTDLDVYIEVDGATYTLDLI
ncbi:MAG: hypothetical protein IT198_00040, partial [Acidimicrobiia bacterium]|nr:hypothetical protein [Acidimicrobiia bacterium]